MTSPADPATLFTLAGLRPIIVPDLGTAAIMLGSYGLVLVDAAADLVQVSDWALTRAAGHLALAQGK